MKEFSNSRQLSCPFLLSRKIFSNSHQFFLMKNSQIYGSLAVHSFYQEKEILQFSSVFPNEKFSNSWQLSCPFPFNQEKEILQFSNS
jgi:hypothetical protein